LKVLLEVPTYGDTGYTPHRESYFHSGAGILTESTSKRSGMVLESELASVEPVEARAEELAREAGFDEDTVSQVAMITREAVINAILHGNKKDPNKHVRVGFELTDEALKITVADEGAGLDPDTVPDPCAPENIMRSSGRGIFLMRAIMDEVHFHQLKPGTEIELVKYRVTHSKQMKKEPQA
jgi:serine/threonine-protein kinase RsbW